MHELPRLSLQVTNFCTGPTPPAKKKKKAQQQALVLNLKMGVWGLRIGWITGWNGEFRLEGGGIGRQEARP